MCAGAGGRDSSFVRGRGRLSSRASRSSLPSLADIILLPAKAPRTISTAFYCPPPSRNFYFDLVRFSVFNSNFAHVASSSNPLREGDLPVVGVCIAQNRRADVGSGQRPLNGVTTMA